MVKNKKVKPIIIMIIVSSIIIIGLIAFNKIYDVIANIELYYIESTTELPLEYKSLFTEDGEKKIGKLMTFAYPNSKKRNKISILEIENNYEVLIYKLSNSDKKIINLYTGICSDIPLQGSIYNKLRSQNCEFNFKGEVDSSWNNGIVATYSGDDSVHYFCKNDSIIILSIDCDKFALKDPKASSADILINRRILFLMQKDQCFFVI